MYQVKYSSFIKKYYIYNSALGIAQSFHNSGVIAQAIARNLNAQIKRKK